VIVGVFAMTAANIHSLSPRGDEWFAYDYGEAIIHSANSACGPGALIMTGHASAPVATVSYLTYVEKRDVSLYIHGISHPSVIGSEARVRSFASTIDIAGREFGRSRTCILGATEAQIITEGYPICGMVSLLDSARHECTSPHDYSVRGVGQEPRDFFSRLLSAEYYLSLAQWHINRGEFGEAPGYLDRAVRFTGDAQTYVQASRSYVAMDRLDDAMRLLEEAVEAEPTHFFAHFALANVLQLKGREKDALSEYTKALRGNPYPTPTHINLGNLHWAQGENALALKHFGAVLEADSTDVSAQMGSAAALEALGRPDEALQYLDRVISAKPDHERAHHVAASLLMRLDRYREARRILAKGIRVMPRNAVLLSDIGLYYLRNDAPDSAIVFLESALEIQSDLLTARGNLAVAYEREGLTAKASEQYRAYIDNAAPGPSRQMAELALKRLTQ
jgi:tetratricopeptide (TPR) repeat protein